MKHAICIIMFCSSIAVSCKAKMEPFDILLESHWQDLEHNNKKKYFNDKWILAANITFKKNSADIVFLKALELSWNGEKINNLIGSLYEKDITGNLMPIEKFHICDGIWKASAQKLILKFKKPKKLAAVNTLCLVLTVPKNIEQKLKKGIFYIEPTSLPEPYQELVATNNLTLSIAHTNQPNSQTVH